MSDAISVILMSIRSLPFINQHFDLYLNTIPQYGIHWIKRQSKGWKKIQQRATKLVPYLKHLLHENRLHRLGLPSLQFQRDRADIINTFRISKGIDNISTSQFFTFNDTNRTHYHPHKLYLTFKKENRPTFILQQGVEAMEWPSTWNISNRWHKQIQNKTSRNKFSK